MKKIGFILFIVVLTICLFIATALLEDFCFKGAGIPVGILLFFAAFAVGDSSQFRERLGSYLIISGPVIALISFFLSFFLEVHVYTTGSNVKIVSRCYTKTLAIGQRLETKKLAYAFSTEYGFVNGIDSDCFYFVQTDHGTCIVLDKFGKQKIELEVPVRIVKQEFKDGTLDFVRDGHGTVFDLHGHRVGKGYTPIKNDYTINDGPLN